jgi:hypothetical protein
MEELSGFRRYSEFYFSHCRRIVQKTQAKDGLQTKREGHYRISLEAAILPNLLKFNISAQWA